jgi:hypothetical protein
LLTKRGVSVMARRPPRRRLGIVAAGRGAKRRHCAWVFMPPSFARLAATRGTRLLPGLAQALAQGLHEIDDLLVALGFERGADRAALGLLLDQRPQGVLVALLELRGIEVACLLLDELAGDVQHARIGRGKIRGIEFAHMAHPFSRAQGGQQQTSPPHLQRADAFARAHDEATD